MEYRCGNRVMLGDEIMVQYRQNQEALARVVAIGLDQVADGIDRSFYDWAKQERILDKNTVVVEWIDSNPVVLDDTTHAKIGNYFTMQSLCCETLDRRQNRLRAEKPG